MTVSLKQVPSTSVFPAKAGTQIQPERLVGFTCAPAFAGETGDGEAGPFAERRAAVYAW